MIRDIDIDDIEEHAHIAATEPDVVLALVARVRELEERVEITTSNPHNPNAITLHVYKRAQEACQALGATSIGDLPVKAREAMTRVRELEEEVERLRKIAEAR